MKCPNCGLMNRPDSQRCDCGYEFLLTEEELDRLRGPDPITGLVTVLSGVLMGGFCGGAIAWAILADTGGILFGAVIGAILGGVGGLVYWQVAEPREKALRWAARHQETGGDLGEAIKGTLARSQRFTVASAVWWALVWAILGAVGGGVLGDRLGGTAASILGGVVGAVLGAGVGVLLGATSTMMRTAKTVALQWTARRALGGRPEAGAGVGALLGAWFGAVAGGLGWGVLWPGHEILAALVMAAVLAPIGGLAGWQLAKGKRP